MSSKKVWDALDAKLKWLDSEEGQKQAAEFAEKWFAAKERKENIIDSQIERFHKNYSSRFSELIDKVDKKYNSKEYRNRWYKRGIEPHEELNWFFYLYAQKYGREATRLEWTKYSNTFTSELYYCLGYFFNVMNGQGTVIHIIKEEPMTLPEEDRNEIQEELFNRHSHVGSFNNENQIVYSEKDVFELLELMRAKSLQWALSNLHREEVPIRHSFQDSLLKKGTEAPELQIYL